ncbi:MAG: hypothetical protein JO141_16050 [Bradyrhizobium sp.]|nr:hypothetical protein [Bradyrhizobium sp.]
MRILRAVRELGGPGSLVVQPAIMERALHAERRHMTVMFCDLLGLSAPAAELDHLLARTIGIMIGPSTATSSAS